MEFVRDKKADNSDKYMVLTEEIVNKAGRTGEERSFILHEHGRVMFRSQMSLFQYRDKYKNEVNDLTAEVIKNLEYLGVEYLIPIGGDDTLSYGVSVCIPKASR